MWEGVHGCLFRMIRTRRLQQARIYKCTSKSSVVSECLLHRLRKPLTSAAGLCKRNVHISYQNYRFGFIYLIFFFNSFYFCLCVVFYHFRLHLTVYCFVQFALDCVLFCSVGNGFGIKWRDFRKIGVSVFDYRWW